MLVLTRKIGETVVIDGDIRITVAAVQGGKVRLAFDAPSEVSIHREEVYRQIHDESPVGRFISRVKGSAWKTA